MIDACRTWRNDDGTEYTVTTRMGMISTGFFARAEPQSVITFRDASGSEWTTAYGSSTSLHRQPDFELRSYLGIARPDPPTRCGG